MPPFFATQLLLKLRSVVYFTPLSSIPIALWDPLMDSGTGVFVDKLKDMEPAKTTPEAKEAVDWQGGVALQDFTQIWLCIVLFIVTLEMNAKHNQKNNKKGMTNLQFCWNTACIFSLYILFSKHLNADYV